MFRKYQFFLGMYEWSVKSYLKGIQKPKPYFDPLWAPWIWVFTEMKNYFQKDIVQFVIILP